MRDTPQKPSENLHPAPEGPVIFFDGVCGLCDRWVDFVLKRDASGQFRFAPLQGESAREWLNLADDQALRSVVLVEPQGTFRKSAAVARILIRLGGRWALCGQALRLIPPVLRDWGYDFIAGRRYRWFGKKESCRLPSAAERDRFLA
ncbi:MAG: thiol-disulfide oxidoreductase DCC family protein [Planctomycetales bacterium]